MLLENTIINAESRNEMQKEAWALTLPSNANSHRSRQNHAQGEVNTEDRLHKDNISIVEWVGDLKNRAGGGGKWRHFVEGAECSVLKGAERVKKPFTSSDESP